MFIHEQTMGASAWKLQCLQEVEELCSSDFDPKYGNRLLLTVPSDESTREAVKGMGFTDFRRGQNESVRADIGGEKQYQNHDQL